MNLVKIHHNEYLFNHNNYSYYVPFYVIIDIICCQIIFILNFRTVVAPDYLVGKVLKSNVFETYVRLAVI